MEEQTAKKKPPSKTRKRKLRRVGPYPFEFRLRAVKMYVEKGYLEEHPIVRARQRDDSGGKEVQPEFWQPPDKL